MPGLIDHIDAIARSEGRADDECQPDYCRLRDYLGYPDGTIRHAGLHNGAHDAPGFWDSVGQNF